MCKIVKIVDLNYLFIKTSENYKLLIKSKKVNLQALSKKVMKIIKTLVFNLLAIVIPIICTPHDDPSPPVLPNSYSQ